MEPRFVVSVSNLFVSVIDISVAEINKLNAYDQEKHHVARFSKKHMAPALAAHYARQLCDQLNQFDAANLAVAKLT